MSTSSVASAVPSLRAKPEVYKDKIEVSLDGRQIFYLFFGGAVIVGMVFVLGVMVGRRVEARGHVDRAQTDSRNDPLAALDRLEGGTPLGNPTAPPVDKAIAAMAAAKDVDSKDKMVTPDAKAEAADAKAMATPDDEETTKPTKTDGKPEAKPVDGKPDPKSTEGKAHGKDPKPAAKSPDGGKPEPKSGEHTSDGPVTKPTETQKSRYTLQLSSFQDKGEAESFLDSVKSAGFSASITEAEVSGKTYYRVRIGNYKSLEAATDAKAEFEKSSKKSASVMKL